jgi:hypothetical protein
VSLTITQATAVNRLADYLLSFDEGTDQHAAVLGHLGTLIPAAYKALGAGYSPERYAEAVDAWDAS